MSDALLPASLDISRKRGDTFTFTIVFNEGGSPKDFTADGGTTFVLSVNSESKPTDTSNEIFSLTGSSITGDASGNVNITLGAVEADQTPKTYYYELQMKGNTSGQIRTLATGKWTVVQDIVKAT